MKYRVNVTQPAIAYYAIELKVDVPDDVENVGDYLEKFLEGKKHDDLIDMEEYIDSELETCGPDDEQSIDYDWMQV